MPTPGKLPPLPLPAFVLPILVKVRAASPTALLVGGSLFALSLALLASGLAVAASSISGVASGPTMMPGAWLAPLKPASHVFTHGVDLAAPHEYSITLLSLPAADGEQTHEVVWDPTSKTAFISIVTSSRLVQVAFDEAGKMIDQVRTWTVGHPEHNTHPEAASLHNVAPSHNYPGMLWLSTETDDRLYLVDPSNGMAVKFALHVPSKYINSKGEMHHIGGPHSVREGPDGSIWAALKGSNYDGPGYDDPAHAAYYKHMMDLKFAMEGEDPPDGWAVWKVHPEKYNSSEFPGKGGVIYEALESPTMTCLDGVGNAWTTQDRSDQILHVDTKGIATQVQLPLLPLKDGSMWSFGNGNGPGAASSPDGSVWLTNLNQAMPYLVRFRPGSLDPTIFQELLPPTEQGLDLAKEGFYTIHLAFSSRGGSSRSCNVMYVLTSSLLAGPGTPEMVIVLQFDEKWEHVKYDGEVGWQRIILPSANSAAHRIAVAEDTEPRSLLVTGLLSNQVYQISGDNL